MSFARIGVVPVCCLGLLLALEVASAQDYQRYAPQPPPSTSTPTQLPNPIPAVNGSDTVLVDKLTGLFFIDSQAKVLPKNPRLTGIRAEELPLLQRPDFAPRIAPYLGHPVSMKALDEIVKIVILYYREHDHPVVDVSVPQQEITGGVIQIVVVEGKVEQVEAKGNRWFSMGLLEQGIRLKPGDPIIASKLGADLDWLNQNPFRSSTAVFTPGQLPGETDVIVQTRDRFPLRSYAGYQDNGNALTGYDRWDAGFNWGNAFGLGQQLNYQFTTSSNVDSLIAHSASYVVPLPWRHTLTLYGAISSSHVLESGFDISGGGAQAGLRYEIPLPTLRNSTSSLTYIQSVYGGYDWKQSDNFVEFGVIPTNNAITDIGEWVGGYKGTETDAWGVLTFNPELDWSPTRTWDFQNGTSYGNARAGADADFLYFKGKLSRTTRLPWYFSLVNDLRGQVANTNLLPSEQMVFGGEDSIRGYDDQDLTATDDGWLIRNELRTPSVSLLALCGKLPIGDQLQFLAFYDYGQTWSHQGDLTLNNGKSAPNIDFEGAGPGLRYTVGQYLTVSADYGFQLHDTGDAEASRWHLDVTFSY